MLMIPLYEQVKQEILKRISSKYWSPGDLLPNEFELADELGVSQGTVRKALNILTDEQVLERRQGKGTFVAKVDFQRFWKHKTIHGKDKIEYTQYINLDKILTPDTVKQFFNDDSKECIVAKWVHHMGDSVILYKVVYIRLGALVDMDSAEIERVASLTESESMSNFLGMYFDSLSKNNLYASTNRLKAIMPDEECQKYLGVNANTPVLLQEYTIDDVLGNCALLGYLYCDSTKAYYQDVVS